jgi:hypothetical protein
MKVKVRGIVLVSITNIRDNNAFIQSVEGDFSELMKDEAKKGAKGFIVENRTVTWDIKGNCKFRFGIEQSIRLEEVYLMKVILSVPDEGYSEYT